ncbi:hypothetical protein RCG67_13755, partial [Kocuria sp. CPCC 205292]
QEQMGSISPRYRDELIASEQHFHELLDRVHGTHHEYQRTGTGPETAPTLEDASAEETGAGTRRGNDGHNTV